MLYLMLPGRTENADAQGNKPRQVISMNDVHPFSGRLTWLILRNSFICIKHLLGLFVTDVQLQEGIFVDSFGVKC